MEHEHHEACERAIRALANGSDLVDAICVFAGRADIEPDLAERILCSTLADHAMAVLAQDPARRDIDTLAALLRAERPLATINEMADGYALGPDEFLRVLNERLRALAAGAFDALDAGGVPEPIDDANDDGDDEAEDHERLKMTHVRSGSRAWIAMALIAATSFASMTAALAITPHDPAAVAIISHLAGVAVGISAVKLQNRGRFRLTRQSERA